MIRSGSGIWGSEGIVLGRALGRSEPVEDVERAVVVDVGSLVVGIEQVLHDRRWVLWNKCFKDGEFCVVLRKW